MESAERECHRLQRFLSLEPWSSTQLLRMVGFIGDFRPVRGTTPVPILHKPDAVSDSERLQDWRESRGSKSFLPHSGLFVETQEQGWNVLNTHTHTSHIDIIRGCSSKLRQQRSKTRENKSRPPAPVINRVHNANSKETRFRLSQLIGFRGFRDRHAGPGKFHIRWVLLHGLVGSDSSRFFVARWYCPGRPLSVRSSMLRA